MNVDGKEDKIGGTDCDAMYKDKKKIFMCHTKHAYFSPSIVVDTQSKYWSVSMKSQNANRNMNIRKEWFY